MGEAGDRRLKRLLPDLLRAVATTDEPLKTLDRVLQVVSNILRRSTYLALLHERPITVSHFVQLCAASPWIAHQLAEQPQLLDELLDARTLYAPPKRRELELDLDDRLAGAVGDLEQELAALRQFRHRQMLRVAAADIAQALPLMKVSDHLTDIAEVVLSRALEMAWRDIGARHGVPRQVDGCPVRFVVVAYGKLGGIELGYGSDLDLVFLHDTCGEEQYTDGDKTLDNARFFARLGQRIINLLSTQTRSGVLYEVDMRLRPSGNSGPMVAALRAFEKYQREDAWTWEHQALLRARSVAGAATVRQQFERLRCDVLREAVRRDTLQHDVATMRARMRRELSRAEPGGFDLKQDRGGVADLEFIVQYLVLRHAADTPQLLTYSDNVRQLEALSSEGVVEQNQAQQLTTIYLAFRQRLHRLALIGAEGIIDAGELSEEREYVAACWDSVFATGGAAG